MGYDIIKRNYERGLWSKQMVKVAVVKNVLTPAQYREIVGEEYIE